MRTKRGFWKTWIAVEEVKEFGGEVVDVSISCVYVFMVEMVLFGMGDIVVKKRLYRVDKSGFIVFGVVLEVETGFFEVVGKAEITGTEGGVF